MAIELMLEVIELVANRARLVAQHLLDRGRKAVLVADHRDWGNLPCHRGEPDTKPGLALRHDHDVGLFGRPRRKPHHVLFGCAAQPTALPRAHQSARAHAAWPRGRGGARWIRPGPPAARLLGNCTPPPALPRLPSRYGISASAAALAADLWHYHTELLHCFAILGLLTTSECCHPPENSLTIPCGVLVDSDQWQNMESEPRPRARRTIDFCVAGDSMSAISAWPALATSLLCAAPLPMHDLSESTSPSNSGMSFSPPNI